MNSSLHLHEDSPLRLSAIDLNFLEASAPTKFLESCNIFLPIKNLLIKLDFLALDIATLALGRM